MPFIIKTDNSKLDAPQYFVKRCGPECVSFSGQADDPLVKQFDTEQEALDEIDWLPEKAGPYSPQEK